jgi:hypothetical protein
MSATAVGVTAAALAGAVAAFQLALSLGARWGGVAYGGRAAREDGSLPTGFRIASAATAVMLLAVAWVVLAAAGVMTSGPASQHVLSRTCWGLTILFALNTAGNLAAVHPFERYGMSAVTAALAMLCATAAVHSPS